MSFPSPPKKLRPSAPPVHPVRADTLLQSPNSSLITSSSSSLTHAFGKSFSHARLIQVCGHTLSGKTAIASDFAVSCLSSGSGVIWFESTHSAWEVRTRLLSQLDQRNLNAHSTSSTTAAPSSAYTTTEGRQHAQTSTRANIRLLVFSVPTLESAKQALDAVKSDLQLVNMLVPKQDRDSASASNPSVGTLSNLGLVVFDSIAAILSPLLGLRVPPAWSGHVAMDNIASSLRWFTAHQKIPVIITNRVVSGTGLPHPALGNSWTALVDVNAMLVREESVEDSDHTVICVSVSSKRDYMKCCKIMISEHGLSNLDI